MSQDAPLAHSAPDAGRAPQSYVDHIQGALSGALANAEALAAHMPDPKRVARFIATVEDATTYHDLGKLDPDNQAALRLGRHARMRWDHVDAGVAHLRSAGAETAAWMVRAHHPPGLPAMAAEFNLLDPDAARRLRGGRIGARDRDAGDVLIAHTDRTLTDLVAIHARVARTHAPNPDKAQHGLFMRFALSCMVDADHADTAWHERKWRLPKPPAPRWRQRFKRLHAYVNTLPKGGARQADRDAFYRACRKASAEQAIVTCEGAVGIGKTIGVIAWCLRRAMKSRARRIIIVAPYTTILSQIAEVLRQALTLDDEAHRRDEVVAEHHHRADFQAIESRDLAVLWRAPIVVTTSLQFFETLAACEPARLRKLHALPGSVVFIDEAHAALPTPLWRQNWAWMRELAEAWGCSFVFASGSLARVWEEPDIVCKKKILPLPDLVPPDLV